MIRLVPAHIAKIKNYEPGKPIEELERELGIKGALKMASNENCLGTSPLVAKAISRGLENIHLYPDDGGFYLVRALADKFSLKPHNFILGDGSNEILEIIVHTFVSPGEEIIIARPSFVIYEIISQIARAKKIIVPLTKDYDYDLKKIAQKIGPKTKLVFIGTPNNPTGTIVREKETEEFLRDIPPHLIVVFDEAYYEYVDTPDFARTIRFVRQRKNVIVLRTFSKIYGLAGLRVGYGLARKELIGFLNRVRRPFNVNSLALTAALAALKDEEHLLKSKAIIRAGKEFLYPEFSRAGIAYVPSQANFILVKVKRGRKIYRQLLSRGVIVRPMDVYGLPDYIRVTIGLKKENLKFIRELKRVL